MADTYTAHYNLTKPEIGGDPDTWGNLLNANMDAIDTAIYNAQTTANAAVPAAGGTMTGPLTFKSTAVASPSGLWRYWADNAGSLALCRNTAAAGDFSSTSVTLFFDQSDVGHFLQRPSFAGQTPWDTGNFNPANYAALAGATFTGGIATVGLTVNSALPRLSPAGNQGTYILWNENDSSGATSIVNNQGGGTGGFIFRNINLSDTVETGRVTFDAAGNITAGGNVTANGSVFGIANIVAYGNLYAGGAGGAQFLSNGNIANGSIWGGDLYTWLANNKLSVGTNAYMHTDNAHNYEVTWGVNGSGTNVIHFFIDGGEQATLIGVAVSDRTAKTRIKSAESRDSLALIESLKFKSFDFKKKYGGAHVPIGTIAQDALETYPEAVIQGDPTGKLYMNERVMLMDALHAIKQLSARVRALEAARH